ncbi:ATP-dependent DNA ligase [Streptomyces rectiverticillatus]|uniref:non-homologous end-joining DNA ligase n=1 Tax=Streptomyces rectiverticillatus TaxID=173860 RepID=UPI0015C34E1C|nr:non-homologous end-joining DNA ligase [Streptomyces rectiverticillatus]QLE76465.1 ATP-dependent DNA ligase [Streptomyces rectiverticillatus]
MRIRTGRHTVEISRPEKVLFPGDGDGGGTAGDSARAAGLTKADLAEYYRTVARRMLPHLRGRPLMLERCPDGVEGECFMQKDVPDHFPEWVHRAELAKEGGTVTHVVCDDTATLVYLAGQACITPHRWLARADRPDCPDRLVVDLDPPGASGDDFTLVRETALLLRELLDELRLPSMVMATGSRGLHVLVPLDRRAPFDDVRAFARDLADVLAARDPDRLTTEPRKTARRGRLYLDTQRNAYAQTAVAPYAVRARPGAPVAAPLSWDEVGDPALTAGRWTVTTVGSRLGDDPWPGEGAAAPRGRSLGPARRRLDALRARS